MSRSFKHTPIYKDHNRGMKEIYNRKVRRLKEVPSGNYYKKLYDSYNISDYLFRSTFEEYLIWERKHKWEETGSHELTEEEIEQARIKYRKYYLNK